MLNQFDTNMTADDRNLDTDQTEWKVDASRDYDHNADKTIEI